MTDEPTTSLDRSVSSEVEVSATPEAAFTAFTDELDLWWVRGPINHWDGGRMREMRCEPGVGGRLLEVYDDDSLELGRITVWEPGRRLAWRSALDDVATEVTFEATGDGTRVRVVARIPHDGKDSGGTAWVRVVPSWFGAWCARRDTVPHDVIDLGRLALALHYEEPVVAARWLANVFGFESPGLLPDETDPPPDEEHTWIEFRLGHSSLMLFRKDDTRTGQGAAQPWVYVDDVASHYRQAQDAGATIVEPLARPWGLPFYVAEDLEANRWTFAQARPTMA